MTDTLFRQRRSLRASSCTTSWLSGGGRKVSSPRSLAVPAGRFRDPEREEGDHGRDRSRHRRSTGH